MGGEVVLKQKRMTLCAILFLVIDQVTYFPYEIFSSAAKGVAFSLQLNTGSPYSKMYSGAMSIEPLHHSSVSEI